MKQNSLIEIGSKGDVILKFNTDTCVNGRNYKKGEPYLFLRDVNVRIGYGSTNKAANQQEKIAAHSNIYPDTVSITGVPFSRRIAALLATFTGEEKTFYKNEMKVVEAEKLRDSESFYFALENPAIDEDIFLYDEDMNLIDKKEYKIIFDGKMEQRVVEDIGPGYYTIFYSSVVNGAEFDLIRPGTPYMTMEIQGIGNINKKDAQVLIKFEKVSLNSLLNFNFIEDGIINAPLEFDILKGNNKVWFEDNE